MSLYTLAVWVTRDGERIREIVNTEWRMEFHMADSEAARLNRDYGSGRIYAAVNVNEIEREAEHKRTDEEAES